MKIQFILHADFELPGILEEWVKLKQFNEAICRPFAGETLPHPNDYDLLILMGGPQSPLQMDESPYLEDEIVLIKETIKAQIPVLGFCLGAQLIGEALGARTERSPYKEVGVFPIELTQDGLAHPLLKGLPTQFPVVHWHNDMPGLTATAKILAKSQGCPRQIICYSPLIYGFQCHPEATRENIETMIHHCSSDLKPGQFVQSREAFLKNDFDSINEIMIHFMDHFILSFNASRSRK